MDFRVNDKKKKDCHFVAQKPGRRIKLCNRGDVPGPCPIACGICCADDVDFTFSTANGDPKNCAWIAKKFDKREEMCREKKIKNSCAETCQSCFEPVGPYICEDNTEFTFETPNGPPKDCIWIDKKFSDRKEFCDRKNVKAACKYSCRRCPGKTKKKE